MRQDLAEEKIAELLKAELYNQDGVRRVVEAVNLRDLRRMLLKAEGPARELLHADLERIVIHPVRSETAKPFARAEVITTGKGLLARVAFVRRQ